MPKTHKQGDLDDSSPKIKRNIHIPRSNVLFHPPVARSQQLYKSAFDVATNMVDLYLIDVFRDEGNPMNSVAFSDWKQCGEGHARKRVGILWQLASSAREWLASGDIGDNMPR